MLIFIVSIALIAAGILAYEYAGRQYITGAISNKQYEACIVLCGAVSTLGLALLFFAIGWRIMT